MKKNSIPNTTEIAENKERRLPDWVWVVLMYCIVMVLISSVGALAIWGGEPPEPHWVTGDHPIAIVRNESTPTENWFTRLFINNWYRWDTPWYMIIAVFGYNAFGQSVVFQPLYPMVIRALHNITGISYLGAALLISRVSSLIALILFYMIIKEQFNSESVARKATILLLVYPAGFFLFAGYTEALFLSLTFAAIYFFLRQKWFWAGLAGGLSTLTRIQGAGLTVLLFCILVPTIYQIEGCELKNLYKFFQMIKKQTRENLKSWNIFPPLIAVFIPLLTELCYIIFLQSSGFVSIPEAQTDWGRKIVMPWEGMRQIIQRIYTVDLNFIDAVEIPLFIFFIVLIIYGFRILPVSYSLYNLLNLGFLLMVGKENYFLTGFTRYSLAIFPIFMVLGKIIKNRNLLYAIISVSLCLNLLMAWLFVNWFWVA